MKTRSLSLRLDVLITVLGLIGAAIFFTLYDQAFPAAALDLHLSRRQIAERAGAEIQALGFDVQGYTSALIFSQDWSGSMHLQRSLGIAEANRLIREEALPVWYWRTRWFKPLQKEEFSLYLAPDGRVVAFFHTIEEAAPGAAISDADARRIAEAYLTGSQNLNMAAWVPVSASSEDQPGGRRDHFFEWKRTDFDVAGAELRVSMTVQGDRAGAFDYWIKVPEEVIRLSNEQSSRASFLDGLSTFFGLGGFSLAAFIIAGLHLFRFGRFHIRALWIALGAGAILLLVGLNSLPLVMIGYDTTQSLTQFWFEALFYGAVGGISQMGFILLLWLGGERAAKLAWPRQDKVLPLDGDRWISLARSSWRGLMGAGILGGYVVLFYLAAVRLLGSWAPMDVGYSNTFATPFPFLYPIYNGVLPAIEEETIFRFVGVSLLVWLIGRRSMSGRILAVLIPGTLWAFAHVTYIRDPYYLRGIEILIPAVLLYGLLYLRFDLTTTIVLHMTYNAMLGALPMLRSGEPYFIFSGLVVVAFLLAPLIPGVLRAMRRRGAEQPVVISLAAPSELPKLTAYAAPPAGAIDGGAVGGADAGRGWEALFDDPAWRIYVLRQGEEIQGFALGRVLDGAGWIEAVHVAPELRGRYHGSRLVDVLHDDLVQGGAASLQATIRPGEHAGRGFLSGLGWSPKSYIFAPGQPAGLMDMIRSRKRRKIF